MNYPLDRPLGRFVRDLPIAVRLSDAARRLLSPDLELKAGRDRLRVSGFLNDALWLQAHMLTRRQVVWWASLCMLDSLRQHESAELIACLRAAGQWATTPTEASRHDARLVGEAAGLTTAWGCLALAAGWSGGNIAPEGVPVTVPAPPDLTARLGLGAILLASMLGQPKHHVAAWERYLDLAEEVASGRNAWPTSHPAPRRSGRQLVHA